MGCPGEKYHAGGTALLSFGGVMVKKITIASLVLSIAMLLASSGAVMAEASVAGVSFISMACVNSRSCMAVGYMNGSGGMEGVLVPINNGKLGSPQLVPDTNELLGVACAVSACLAVGENASSVGEGVVVPITNGHAGHVEVVPGTVFFDGVGCSTGTSCVAVGSSIGAGSVVVPITADTPGVLHPVSPFLQSVTCPSAHTCYAVGDSAIGVVSSIGVVLPITNGIPGTARQLPNTTDFTISAVACGSASTCDAVGYDTFQDEQTHEGLTIPILNGTPGSAHVLKQDPLRGVACISANVCVAVGSTDEGIEVPIMNGVPGSPKGVPDTEYLGSAACSNSTTCWAVGGTGTQGTVVSLPVSAAGTYVALGDSYSSGEGNPPYMSGTNTGGRDECHRSALAYPIDTANQVGYYGSHLSFHACSGAVIQDFYSANVSNHERAQLNWLNSSTTLVTLTIGGNNADFVPVMTTCVLSHYCQLIWQREVNHAISVMGNDSASNPGSLMRLFVTIRHRAPHARVLVVGYPRLFPEHPPLLCATGFPDHYFVRFQMDWINTEIRSMDNTLRAAAQSAGVKYVSTYDAFNGHELCTNNPFSNRVIKTRQLHILRGSFHPNASGHLALARLVEADS
jgi:hypothetical protein